MRRPLRILLNAGLAWECLLRIRICTMRLPQMARLPVTFSFTSQALAAFKGSVVTAE